MDRRRGELMVGTCLGATIQGLSHPTRCPHPWGVPGALPGCSASPVRMLDHPYWSAHQFPPGCSVPPSGQHDAKGHQQAEVFGGA